MTTLVHFSTLAGTSGKAELGSSEVCIALQPRGFKNNEVAFGPWPDLQCHVNRLNQWAMLYLLQVYDTVFLQPIYVSTRLQGTLKGRGSVTHPQPRKILHGPISNEAAAKH